MKILIVEYRDITHPEAGGAEVILLEIFKRIVALGHKVDYLCNGHGHALRDEYIEGIRILRRGRQPYFNFLVPWVYRSELKKNGYDVIIEGIDKLPFFMPLFEKKVPVLCVIPHLFGTTVFREASVLVGAYVYSYERLIPFIYRNSMYSVLSQGTREDLEKRGIPAQQVKVIYSGLSQDQYEAPLLKPDTDHPILIYLGRIKKYKGIELGFEAVKQLKVKYPSIEYQVVGTGDYLDELKRLAVRAGVQDHVSFLGHKRGREKMSLLQKASVLLYTSPKEGWGLSVVEANLCGTVVVASDSQGLRESVLDGKTGFLVPHGDTQVLAQRIDQLLSNPDMYAKMRADAITWAKSFTWERATEETMSLLQETIQRFSAQAHK